MSLLFHPQKNGKMGGGLHDPSEERLGLVWEYFLCLLYLFLGTRGIKGEKYGILYCHTIVVHLYGA